MACGDRLPRAGVLHRGPGLGDGQRLGQAQDCAGTFLYLASDAASGYVTGQVIEVNGGQLMA